MKFLCPNCKAKYQISDEKIAGRTLKMDCRRCNHPIVIRGDMLAAQPLPEPERRPSPHAAPHASPRRGRSTSHVGPAPSRTSSRSALGADFRKNASAPPAPARPTALDQWHVAINDVPVGPMKRDEVAQKIAAGAVDKSSLVWREGLDDWRELHMVPELAALLRKAAAPPPPQKPAFPAPPRGALGRAPGPARPGRPPTGRTAPRPAESQRPAARGNVVPIGGRHGASAAPELDDLRQDDFLDDEPTRVGSAVDFEALEREARASEEAAQLEGRRRASEEARHRAELEERQRAERARQAEDERRRAAAAVPAAPAAIIAHDDAFDPFASQRGASPLAPSSPGAFPASSPGAFAAPPASSPGFAQAQPYAPQVERRRRAIPIGAWIAIAGAMAFGVALAVMVGTRLLQPPPAVATNVPAPTVAPNVPELDVPEVPVAPTEVEDPTLEEQPTEVEGAPRGTTGPRASRSGTGGSAPSAPATTSAGRTAAAPVDPRFARFADDTAEAAPIAPRATSPLDEGRSGGGGGELNADQIRAVVTRERAGVQRCYETAARASGQAPGLRLDVDVTIGGSGTVTGSRARGQSFGSLTECVERSVMRWRFPATGGVTRTSIPFVFQGRD